ncbi:MAG: UDP-glucose/GDP-mannose dehydrogenase family protein [Vicinamibacterales bacterium]
MQVSIVGAGYVGLVTGLCLADRGHHVTCVDVDSRKIVALSRGILPIHEPGLPELLAEHLGRRFVPTTDIVSAVADSNVTMITVGTPLRDGAISLDAVESAAVAIGQALARKDGYHLVIVKSTVVPGTTEGVVRRALEAASGLNAGRDFGLGMNPEFLREGEAVEDFQKPDRIVLGGLDARSLDLMSELYAAFPAEQVRTNPRTAEMIKYVSNALLATLISFSNEMGNLCSAAPDVDVTDVLGAVHLDKRISPVGPDGQRTVPTITSYLRAGCGFGGSCFPKDVRALISWGAEQGRHPRLLDAVLEINERQPLEVISLLKRRLPDLEGVRVAILGLAFKAQTDDVRESPALRVIQALTSEGARVVAFDPVAMPAARLVLGAGIEYARSLADAVRDADAVVLLTSWPEFRDLEPIILSQEKAPILVDGRRFYDASLTPCYEGIGLGPRGPVPASATLREADAAV